MILKNTFLATALIFCLLYGCTHSSTKESVELTSSELTPGTAYSIQIPAGWHEVTNYKEVKRRILWGVINYNYTKFGEPPIFRAWDSPENLYTTLTIMEVKRHCSSSMRGLDDLKRDLKNAGWIIQESGVTEINNKRCKWWVQCTPDYVLHQKCYYVGNENKWYAIAFTSPRFTIYKSKIYDEIVQTIKFIPHS